jgi:hypothetical protein
VVKKIGSLMRGARMTLKYWREEKMMAGVRV